jgi:hypothetical protein
MKTNGFKDPDINLRSYSQLIFDKGAQHLLKMQCFYQHDGEKTASSTNIARKIGYPHVEEDRRLSLALYQNQLKMDLRP